MRDHRMGALPSAARSRCRLHGPPAPTPVEAAFLPRPAVPERVTGEPSATARQQPTLPDALHDAPTRLAAEALHRAEPVRRATGGPGLVHAGQAGMGAEIGATRVSVNRACGRSSARL
ncbi:MAG: hypothetical protein HOQ38_07990 [Nonomuraea sp.]|nr:hypothetical protein [Nonomuraea sp.]